MGHTEKGGTANKLRKEKNSLKDDVGEGRHRKKDQGKMEENSREQKIKGEHQSTTLIYNANQQHRRVT